MANLAEAEKFLNLLDECADKFTFQTFDDDKHRKSPQLARWLHGDAVTLHDTLNIAKLVLVSMLPCRKWMAMAVTMNQ